MYSVGVGCHLVSSSLRSLSLVVLTIGIQGSPVGLSLVSDKFLSVGLGPPCYQKSWTWNTSQGLKGLLSELNVVGDAVRDFMVKKQR